MPADATRNALETGWDYPDPFLHQLVVEARHIDDFRHTNNAVYLGWMSETAWEHSKALGMGFDLYRQLNRGMVVRRHEMEYFAPALEGEHIAIATWIAVNDGRLRIVRRFQMRNAGTGVTLFRGLTEFVCINMETGKPARMPKEFAMGYPVSGL